MKRLLIIALVLVTELVTAQESENRSVDAFTGVKAQQGIDVYLKKGTKESVRVETNNVPLKDIYTEVSGGYLRIHLKNGNYNHVNVKVYVTYVKLTAISATSAASIFCEGIIKADKLSLAAGSSGSVEVQVEAGDLEASASSAGEIQLQGKVENASVNAATAGEVNAYGLLSNNADIEVSTAGSVKISVVKEIKARATTGGDVRYRGNPERSNTSASTGGSVKKSN